MSMIIALLFTGVNVYFAIQAFREKRWVWFAISTVLALWCASPLLLLIQ